jgi:chemotaxis protein MotA
MSWSNCSKWNWKPTSTKPMKLADALPGFGIVAAVLGIVTTMSQLGGDTSQIGEHIAGALVGTFLGILLCYGFVGPLAAAMESRVHEDGKAFECVKVALLSSLRGYNPKVSVEFARKTLSAHMRPNFQDFEEHLKGARAGAPA